MTVVIPTNRPMLARCSCVIERVTSAFVLLCLCPVFRLGKFVIRLRQLSCFIVLSRGVHCVAIVVPTDNSSYISIL